MILKISFKILQKEWRKLLLPFLSVLLTTIVVTTSFLLINSAKDFLILKNKEILGGDISFEANRSFELGKIIDKSILKNVGEQVAFQALFTKQDINTGVSLKVVDENFPLYGQIVLRNKEYEYLKAGEIYIDENLEKSFQIKKLGEDIYFNNATFTVKGIIKSDPEDLIPSFNFSGKAVVAQESLNYAKINLDLFRKEYKKNIILNRNLSKNEIEDIKNKAKSVDVRVQIDITGQGGFGFALEVIERFLVITILIISVLSLVNIYASVNYLSIRLRRSFAILISLGMPIINIYKILFIINFAIIFISILLGLTGSIFITNHISQFIDLNYKIEMFFRINYLEFFYIAGAILTTSIFATIPVINRMRNISPKELLQRQTEKSVKNTFKNILVDVFVGILPITLLAIFFLNSFLYGLIAIIGIVLVYAGLMIFYYYFINILYKKRNVFNFPLKMITSQKKFDGFFGLITFASLFVALVSIYNLSIVRTSVEEYLKNDLKRNLPSTYILDIQKSQKDKLLENFKEITLFPNIRARIISIDDVDVQKELDNKSENLDRELGREFNLTYRNYLLSSEKIYKSTKNFKFSNMGENEVSLEKDFAKRVNIKLGSNLVFSIQGIKINVKVTSIREVDTRSGYPFFYFILSTKTLEKFPQTFFGFANYNEVKQNNLKKYLSQNVPNANIINTKSITNIAENLINILLLIILIITIPPLFLSSMLIVTILGSVATERKRDGARLMALGKTQNYVRNYYIIESTSTVVLASSFAYILSVILSNFLIIKYLKIENIVYFDFVSFYIFVFILLSIILTSITLWKSSGRSLKEYLNYEENN